MSNVTAEKHNKDVVVIASLTVWKFVLRNIHNGFLYNECMRERGYHSTVFYMYAYYLSLSVCVAERMCYQFKLFVISGTTKR